jgi:hypothetical protein
MEGQIDKTFSVDATLDALSGSFPSSFLAHISFNVTWKFANTFHFHGTVLDGTLVAREKNAEFVEVALIWLEQCWSTVNHNIRVIFIGVGLSARNGVDIKKFLDKINEDVSNIVIVDPGSMTVTRTKWLTKNIPN